MININQASPINWSHSLNRGLVLWMLGGVQGRYGGDKWRGLTRHTGTLTNMTPRTGWVGSRRKGSYLSGGALIFDGSDDYVEIPHESALQITTGLTVSAWILAAASQADATGGCIVSKESSVSGRAYQMQIIAASSPVWSVRFRCNGLTTNVSVDGGMDMRDAIWHHVAGVYNGSNLLNFRDGKQVNSVVATGSISTNTTAVRIGRFANDAQEFTGRIDDVRIWKRALAAEEMREYFNLSATGYAGLLNPIYPGPPGASLFNASWAAGSNVMLGAAP